MHWFVTMLMVAVIAGVLFGAVVAPLILATLLRRWG